MKLYFGVPLKYLVRRMCLDQVEMISTTYNLALVVVLFLSNLHLQEKNSLGLII